jgi:PAS domain S-box-containing protein
MVGSHNRVSLDSMLAGLGTALFSSIRTPFGVFDKDCRIVWLNKAMAAIHRCDPERAIGTLCSDSLRCGDQKCDDCFLRQVLAQGKTKIVEAWADFPDGQRRWGEVHAYPVRGQDKSISAVIVLIFDTTGRRKALQRQKEYSGFLEQQLNEKGNGTKKVNRGGEDDGISVKLSRRENDVLRLVTEGYTNSQISELLHISANTVKTHVNSLFNKLGVNDRTQAAVMAARNNLI